MKQNATISVKKIDPKEWEKNLDEVKELKGKVESLSKENSDLNEEIKVLKEELKAGIDAKAKEALAETPEPKAKKGGK